VSPYVYESLFLLAHADTREYIGYVLLLDQLSKLLWSLLSIEYNCDIEIWISLSEEFSESRLYRFFLYFK
jgi:hypothetical protein